MLAAAASKRKDPTSMTTYITQRKGETYRGSPSRF